MASAQPWIVDIQPTGTRRIEQRQVFASSRADARRQVDGEGTIIDVRQWKKPLIRLPKSNKKAIEHTASLLRDLSARMRGGSPAEAALLALVQDEADNELRAALQPALRVLKSGRDAVAALEATGLIDPVALSILRSGQRMRDMDSTIEHAIEQMIKRDKNKATFAGRLGWVGWEAVGGVFSLVFYLAFLIPIVRRMGVPPEVNASLDLVEIRCVIELLVFAVGWLGGAWLLEQHRSPDVNRQDMLHRIPVLGTWFDQLAMIDTVTSLARMTRARMTPTETMSALARGARGPELRALLTRAAKLVRGGRPMAKLLAHRPFTIRERSEIKAYRNGEHLAKILDSIAAVREREADKARDRVISWLFWIMFVYMAVTMWEGYVIGEAAQNAADHGMSSFFNIFTGGAGTEGVVGGGQ